LATGIRVNQLAKELGVESKAILQKLRDEGLGDQAPNHMSVLKLGLAASVREWFAGEAGGGGGTAVQTAAPVEVATKPKTSRARKTKQVESESMGPTTLEQPREKVGEVSTEAEEVVRPVYRRVTTPTEPAPAPSAPSVEAPAAPAPVAPPAPSVPATTTTAPPSIAAEAPAPAPAEAPAPPEAPAAPAAPVAPRPPQQDRSVARPTITLANRGGATIERKPVTPAPQLVKPAAAVIQGPRVVREEKPDVVPLPRARRPLGGGASEPPAFTQARPQGGRGVKTSDDETEESAEAKKKAKSGRTLSNRRRGPDGRRGEAMEKLREFTDADLIERRDRLAAAASYRTGFDSHLRKSEARGTHALAKTAVQRGEPIELDEPITVKTLSAALGIKSNDIIKKLMQQGVFATVNQSLDTTVAGTIALDYGLELRIRQQPTLEEQLMEEFRNRQVDAANLRPRPPVVTILGHVDHGKTSLLDKIRSANVAAGEAGGITQHTAAWMVTVGEGEAAKRVTFIDTPGHQAFTAMRARGANMTDVVVLVVAAVEGVMPQTIESINHARAAGVPIVVALNKIDRPDANPDMVLGQLAKEGLNPVEWGGETEVIRTSAVTGTGIKELIEILDYQAELLELRADPSAPARGTVIESRVDPGLGAVATVLVQDGTLRLGDVTLSGPGYGRMRSLLDDNGRPIQEAGPSTPVIVSGLSQLPDAGDKFFALDDYDRARSIAEERASQSRREQLAGQSRVTADNLLATIRAGDVKTINLIIKGDVQGSVETLSATVTGQNTEEVRVKVIHAGVGGITESDVQLAMASRINPEDPQRPNKVAIIGFHVVPDESARQLAEQNHIDVKLYKVIYEIFDDLKKALSGMLSKEVREKIHGHAEIRQVFKVSRIGNIAGCMMTDGHIVRTDKIRLIRDGKVITDGLSIESLKRLKDDVKEVKSGFECGIKIAGYDDIKLGDRLEAYITEEFERTL
jgi:translation initiation factor IF-2